MCFFFFSKSVLWAAILSAWIFFFSLIHRHNCNSLCIARPYWTRDCKRRHEQQRQQKITIILLHFISVIGHIWTSFHVMKVVKFTRFKCGFYFNCIRTNGNDAEFGVCIGSYGSRHSGSLLISEWVSLSYISMCALRCYFFLLLFFKKKYLSHIRNKRRKKQAKRANILNVQYSILNDLVIAKRAFF